MRITKVLLVTKGKVDGNTFQEDANGDYVTPFAYSSLIETDPVVNDEMEKIGGDWQKVSEVWEDSITVVRAYTNGTWTIWVERLMVYGNDT